MNTSWFSQKRRWLRFSLRGMLLGVMLLAAWLGWHVHRVQVQTRVVERVHELGGNINYDFETQRDARGNYTTDPKAVLPFPRWIIRLLGVDHFSNVTIVSLRQTSATDEDLRLVGTVRSVEVLDLTETKITGVGLRHLVRLSHLRILSLWNTRVDDEGLTHLAGHREMWSLVLDGSDVTDAGLVHLHDMDQLEEWLGLSHTKVSDRGIEHLFGFKALRSLTVIDSAVSKDGVRKLRAELPLTSISR
jgi:hypothetical protein